MLQVIKKHERKPTKQHSKLFHHLQADLLEHANHHGVPAASHH